MASGSLHTDTRVGQGLKLSVSATVCFMPFLLISNESLHGIELIKVGVKIRDSLTSYSINQYLWRLLFCI